MKWMVTKKKSGGAIVYLIGVWILPQTENGEN